MTRSRECLESVQGFIAWCHASSLAGRVARDLESSDFNEVSMKTQFKLPEIRLLLAASLAGVLLSCQSTLDHSAEAIGLGDRRLFRDGVATILEYRCLECHNALDAPRHAGLNLESRATAFTTGTRAPVIIPGEPAQSLLYRVLEVSELHPTFMPPKPDRLWQNEMKVIHEWIEAGAYWPDGEEGKLIRPQDWPTH